MALTTFDTNNDIENSKEFHNALIYDNTILTPYDSPILQDGLEPDSNVIKTLTFRHTGFTINWTVSEVTESSPIPIYFVKVHALTMKKPDIVVYEGNDQTGARLACSHIHFLPPFRFGLGDPEGNPNDISWYLMKNISRYNPFVVNKFEFDVEMPNVGEDSFSFAPGNVAGKKKTFVWIRTHATANGVTGVFGKMSFRNYKLIDVESGQIVAVFLANCLDCFKSTGELRLFQEVPKVLEVAIVVTCATLVEYLKRTQ